MDNFKSGFVSILGRPNAGKSSLLNQLVQEKMAIVSHKVQTTRHRIKAFLNTEKAQVVFSDTPGIIDPQYRLHEKMMGQVKSALEDADLILFVFDIHDPQPDDAVELIRELKLKTPLFLVINKTDLSDEANIQRLKTYFEEAAIAAKVFTVSAATGAEVQNLVNQVIEALPEGLPFYSSDDLSDLPSKFFVSELIREQIYKYYHEEIPYHTAVIIQEFKEKTSLIKIRAEIIVQRETQKFIIIGEGGKMIKKIGTEARLAIEAFLDSKVFLELFVKVRPKWRDNELHLREYGY